MPRVSVMLLILVIAASGAWAARFDGHHTHVEVPAVVAAALDGASGATVTARVTRDVGGLGRRNEILDLTVSGTNSKLVLGFDAEDRLRVGGRTRGTEDFQFLKTTGRFTDPQERHLAGVMDVAGREFRLYVDGVLQEAEGTPPEWTAEALDGGTGTRHTLGASAQLRHYFMGQIRDVRVYDRALEQAEIAALAGEGEDEAPATGLVFHWDGAEEETRPERAFTAPLVDLSGSPQEIGRIWGETAREAIHEGLEDYLSRAQARGLTPEVLLERAETYVGIVERIAPHWLEEARALATAAGVDPDLYVSMLANNPRGIGLEDDCTSYALSREVTEGNAIFFHRTRDNRPGRQAAVIVDSSLPGINKFLTIVYAHSVQPSVAVNEKGLAASADMGGPSAATPKYRGLMNGAMLRYIMERAGDCEEALALVQQFVEEGWYAGGRPGTRWTFVDRTGRIMDVAHSSDPDSLRWEVHTGKAHITRRGNAQRRLEEATEPVSFLTFRDISRDPSMLFAQSIAGMTVDIHPEFPEHLTLVWISLPADALPFPLLLGGRGTPAPLFDGTIYNLCAGRRFSPDVLHAVERNLYHNGKLLRERLEAVLQAGGEDRVPELIDAWVRDTTAVHLLLLEGVSGPGGGR